MGSASPQLKDKYTEILKSNGIEDEVSEVIITKPDLRGMHMGSIIETARVDFVSGRDPLHLFVKKKLHIPTPEMDRSFSQVMVTEGTFLTDFVQEMKHFLEQRSGGPDISDLFPQVYYRDESMIIQEDLTKRGFAVLPNRIKRSVDETKTVFEHLARLHAVSHVMIARAGGPEAFLKSHPYLAEMMKKDFMGDIMSQSFEPPFDYCFSFINASTREDKQEKFDLLDKYRGNLSGAFLETIDAETLIYTVNHGDFWNNNMMWDTASKKIIFVDLQCPRVNSPSMDLIRFLFFSSAPDVRKSWKELLEYYFDTLKEYVLALEHPFPFRFEDFVKDFHRKGKMDFLGALLTIPGFEAIEGHDTEEADGYFGGFKGLLVNWTKKNPEKVSAIGDRMVEMTDDFLLFAEL